MKKLLLILLIPFVCFSQYSTIYRSEFTYPEGKNWTGIMILDGDDLKFSRGNEVANFDHAGNSISYDRTAPQYTQYTGTVASVETNDVIDAFWLKTSNVTNNQYVAGYITRDGIWFYGSDGGGNDGKIERQLYDGTNTTDVYWTPSHEFRDGNWHNIAITVVGMNKLYFFLDGKFDYYALDSTPATSSSISKFRVGGAMNGWYMDGNIDEYRRLLQGTDGLYVTGTGGTDLEIRVGNASGDIIYSEVSPYSPANPGGMIPLMYKSPAASLSEIGYGSLEDADRTEQVTNGGFDTDTDWTKDAGCTIAGGVMHFDGVNSVSKAIQSAQASSLTDVCWVSTVTISNYVSGNLTIGFAGSWDSKYHSANGTYIDIWIPADIDGSSNKLYIYTRNNFEGDVDNVSVKRIGEVAHYKMNETGTPATLVDETSNGLDLTTSGSPSMVTSYIQSPKTYNSLNPHTGSLSIWLRCNFEGDDNSTHYIYSEQNSATDKMLLYKNSSNSLVLNYDKGDTSVTASYSISSWNSGDWHHIVAEWNKNSIDGTDYLHLYIDGAEVVSSSAELGKTEGVESEWDFGSNNASSQFDGIIAGFQIFDYCLPATESAAETMGLNPKESVEGIYGSGSGIVPIVDEGTRFLLVE